MVSTGRFGDLFGNIERALNDPSPAPLVVVVEWSDLDPRLGLREPHRRDAAGYEESLLAEATGRLARLRALLASGDAASTRRIVLRMPVLALPPWLNGIQGQKTSLVLRLEAEAALCAAGCAGAGVLVADATAPADHFDARSWLNAGFPYTIAYTDHLSSTVARLLLPSPVKKGLVTDLDNTFWLGIAGDDGPQNVCWSLDKHARIHGIYQQFLAALASQGVLVAAASKNDPAIANEALDREDTLLPPGTLFPVEAHWGPKTESLQRIAKAWNIGLDAIVFVDDNPLEVDAVREAFPEVECHLFPPAGHNEAAVLDLLRTLQQRFARERVTEEDRIRAASLRSGAEWQAQSHAPEDSEALVAGLRAHIGFDFSVQPFDGRAFELLNKTNQFNLNGLRWEESEYRRLLADPSTLLCVASYEDRFGPLGKIAVALGTQQGSTLHLKSWVMSCRAFSRRIEFETLRALFERAGASAIQLDWKSTPRNSPTHDMLAVFFDETPEQGLLTLSRSEFEKRSPRLHAQTELTGPIPTCTT